VRAIRFSTYGGPEVLTLDEVPAPQAKPGHVLIKVHAAGVNPVDAKIRSGMLSAFFPLNLPAIAGRDGAGTVVDSDTDLTAGQRVCFIASDLSQGSYSEYTLVDRKHVVPAPRRLAVQECAAIPLPALSAYIALMVSVQIERGMHVLVHGGAGGIGGLAVQLARYKGAEVTATCSHESAPYAKANGAQNVVEYDRQDFSAVCRDMDVVLDTIGGEVHDRSYVTLKRGGVLVYLLAQPIRQRGAEFGVDVRQAPVFREVSHLAAACRLFEEGVLQPRLRAVLPLAEAARAHQEIQKGHGHGKLVLEVSQ
jgi:NADPH:quinone reductase-like Zn-dependent oxidoreductase